MRLDAGTGAQPVASSTRPAAARSVALHTALALAFGLALGGCSVIDKPVRPAVYDFGPGPLATLAAAPASQPAITLAEVESGAALDSTAVLYRLTYTNAQQLLPYAQARWSMAPEIGRAHV